MSDYRRKLLSIYNTALDAVRGTAVVRHWLESHPVSANLYVVAIGKAAESMYEGAVQVAESSIQKALLITKHGHFSCPQAPHVSCLESSHPVPDESSLTAGRQLLDFIANAPKEAEFLFLISGGTSALVEVLPEGMDATDLSRMNSWLLSSGMDINRMNRVRRAFSSIKGGRLAPYLANRKTHCLMISDVIGDDPAIVGSGLLVSGREGPTGLSDIQLPGWLQAYAGLATEAPAATDSCFQNIEVVVVAGIHDAMRAAAEAGKNSGYDVYLHEDLICCDAESTGKRLAQQVLDGNPVLHVWGGETVVILPDNPGRGGRNQHLALAAATVLEGQDNCYVLAAGTDGSDGPSEDTGALVDGQSLSRAAIEGQDAQDCLNRADAGTFLEASKDLIQTGPTGTNVMDIVLGLKVTD